MDTKKEERRWAEKTLGGMLLAAGIPVRACYAAGEIGQLLGIAEHTFEHMVRTYEVDPATGQPKNPATLDSFRLSNRSKVPYDELLAYLVRNRHCERRKEGAKPGA